MILNRALLRETVQTCGAVAMVLLSIFMVIRLVSVLRQAAEGVIPLDSVMQLLFLRLMTNVDIILPLVLYVSVLMVLGRWSRDNEMAVINACGISPAQFMKPLMGLAIVVSMLVGLFSLYLSPLSVRVIESIQQQFESNAEITGLSPGVFTETRRGGVYFIERFNADLGYYENIFFYGQEQGDEIVVIASIGFQSVDVATNDLFLVLKDGTRYTGVPGETEYTVIDFETYAIRLEEKPANNLAMPVKGMTTGELLKSGHHIRLAELNWRISKVMVIPVLILFAVAFSSVDARSRRVSKMIFAFLCYFAYANLIGFAIALMRKGDLDPRLGVWYVHGVFLMIGMYLLNRHVANKPIIPRLFGKSRPKPGRKSKSRVRVVQKRNPHGH
ncbi:MAG: lipopolysaccharide export system permease protein [Parasphingorhabdus sp.]